MDYITTTSPNVSDIDLESVEKAIVFRAFGITIAVWAIFVGAIGNLLTILTYISNLKLRTTFNLFLVNLAVIDFWTAVGMLPFNLAGYVRMQWPFPESPFTARLQAFQYFACGYTSVTFLVAITINRLIGVMFPGKYARLYSRRRTIAVLIFCNVFAPITLLPFLVGTDERCTTAGQALTGYHAKQFLCTFICLPSGSAWDWYMQVIRVIFQFVPLIVMITIYSIIFTMVKRKRDAITVRMTASLSTASTKSILPKTAVNGQNKKSEQEQRRQREDKRMAVISVSICIAFTVTFLPSVIVNLLPNRHFIDIRWHMAASNVTWFNSSVNPIIYVLLNRRFRREYWRIVKYAFGSVKGRFIRYESSIAYTAARPVRSNSQANTNSVVEDNRNAVNP